MIVLQLVLSTVALAPVAARDPSAPAMKVPRWDARGVGLLPWQGVACLDVNEDATRIALGTIAPPGDPNVLLLDGDGKVLRQHAAGQRWINQVALGADGELRAICTMPAGRAGDMPDLFRLTPDSVAAEGINWRQGYYAQGYFHYGDHSNHVTRLLARQGRFTVVVNGDQVHWLSAKGISTTAAFPLSDAAIPVAVTAESNGFVVVGITAAPSKDKMPPNLYVLHSSRPRPLWSRAMNVQTAAAPWPERGRYGTPTLPNGSCQELPQRDDKVWSPRAVALHVAEGQDATTAKRLVAAADYQRWQRWVRSSATGKDQNLGVRFMPSRPTVTIYDQDGKLPKYKVVRLDIGDGNQVRFLDSGDRKQTLIAGRFSGVHLLGESMGKVRLTPFQPETKGAYVDVRSVDLNGDGRPDLVTSHGHVYLRGTDGKLAAEPTLRLKMLKGDWHFLQVGDFNGDRRLDVVLLSYGMHGQASARVFYNRGKADKPFDNKPDAVIPLNPAQKDASLTLLRDTPVVCDWNGDGIDDLAVGREQSQEVLILLGGREGLDASPHFSLPPRLDSPGTVGRPWRCGWSGR